MIEPSCTLLASPTLIGAISPRSTAPYQTLARAPSVTSPSTKAPGAMQALRWMLITPSWGPRGTAPRRPRAPRSWAPAPPRGGIELRPSQRLAVQGGARALRHALERQPPGRAGRGWGGWLVGAGRVVPRPPRPPRPPGVGARKRAARVGAAGAVGRGAGV